MQIVGSYFFATFNLCLSSGNKKFGKFMWSMNFGYKVSTKSFVLF